MDHHQENSLQNQLKLDLENSEWLQKFKRISDILQYIKKEIPLTQLCKLRWITDNDSLVIDCPNEEIWQDLSQQQEKMQKVSQQVKPLILKYADSHELIFE